MLAAPSQGERRFQFVLIKPSHYDDDGYVIQWLLSSLPSNSLACLCALARDAAQRQVLGAKVAIDVAAIDETNTKVNVTKIVSLMRRHGGFGVVGLVGVQTNQFPRALDVARLLREAGIRVVIGGFHVSGCLAMLPELQDDLKAALGLGCSLFAGEAEGRMDEVLRDAAAGTLKPIYNYMNDLPALEGAPTPYLPKRTLRGTFDQYSSFDAGRGCPYQCSFCTIINVQGRKSRGRSPDDVERLVRHHWAQGISRFFVTDDNFSRNKDWEPILDRLIALRERHGIAITMTIQVDTQCHKIPNFITKAARAGVTKVFIGLESINPTNLIAAKKRQNKITEYRTMLLAWKHANVLTYAGYILGFAADTPEAILADIEIIKKELPIDILEFMLLTPLPGSEDHRVLWQSGGWMDPDMNKYDAEHVVSGHPLMSAKQWRDIYRKAWAAYYTQEHRMTILRRGAACGMGMARLTSVLFAFWASVPVEDLHPLQIGAFRRKSRRDRRPGFPIEPIWSFYPKYAWEIVSKHARLVKWWIEITLMARCVRRDPDRLAYMDKALMPVTEEEIETLKIFTHSEAAREEINHVRKVAALTKRECRSPRKLSMVAEALDEVEGDNLDGGVAADFRIS